MICEVLGGGEQRRNERGDDESCVDEAVEIDGRPRRRIIWPEFNDFCALHTEFRGVLVPQEPSWQSLSSSNGPPSRFPRTCGNSLWCPFEAFPFIG
ncbi:unnamed protein product [Nippostrongylus brasiliensis]|uniref:Uncharacterized protein n=1 Tax=Nippostrongylus brasiliensis TaxID=27835 RepID=A0A0N4XTQ4_NIPBR|nr:unnamed protein product [Nippostrongylus brasiliensis]